ncbi:MAG TPA: DUF885 domain-containing protein [Steroidobacteraceae bacterium]|nr:DUF885 domain-containing protein [Steroidobacteraceae bacterium]
MKQARWPTLAMALLAVAGPALAAAPATSAAPTAEDARLTAFLDGEFAQELQLRPQLATRLGNKEGADRLDDLSDAGQLKRIEWRRASVARMKAQFDRAKLSSEAQVNYDIWALELERAELSYKYRAYSPPFYSFLSSVHTGLVEFMVNTHTVQSAADARNYAARVRAIPATLDAAIARTRLSSRAGVHTPKFQVENVISGSKELITGAPFGDGPDTPLWKDIKAKVGKLQAGGKVTPAEAEALLADARTALLAVKPAYERVIAWAQSELPTAPSGRVGAISLPGGAEYYAAALKLSTTTDLTAEQIHQIGLKEVARIESEQDALARQAGFKDREAFRAERERLYPPKPWTDASRAEYLRESNAAIARVTALLPKYFGLLPAHPIEVVREPSFTEIAGGSPHAQAPSPDGTRPGRVYVHLLGNTNDPAVITDLMCHEGAPGHVMQGDIQIRQAVGPKFRKSYGYVAFGEGWGLYVEALCKEMGAYPDIASDYMRLGGELTRAVRLVVDTGIHAKGWTEDQAVDYITKTLHTDDDHTNARARRYITNPGQATGYMIGMIKIVELRRKAEHALGPKFDIKGFHDLVIGSGSQPLAILERRVDDWIATRR